MQNLLPKSKCRLILKPICSKVPSIPTFNLEGKTSRRVFLFMEG